MDRKNINDVEKVTEPTISALGYELVETEYLNEFGRWTLRLYIDVEGRPITVEDCEKVSRAVSAILDVEDPIKARYNLEVSSPGINRPLRRPKDFAKFVGHTVKIKTDTVIVDRKNLKGKIVEAGDEVVKVLDSGNTYDVPLSSIIKARLEE